jgi:hypothetical protein
MTSSQNDPQGPHSPAPMSAGANAAASAITELLVPFRHEAQATRQMLDERNRSQRRINSWLIGFVAITSVLVAMMLVILIQDNQRRAQSRRIIRNNEQLSRQIADCTNTDGACYKRSQQRLAVTFRQLVESNLAIARCARTAETDAELDACVKPVIDSIAPPLPAQHTPAPAPSPSS